MNEIVLKQDIIDSFLQHGEKDYPFECCGFILGHFIDEKSVGTEYIAIPNTKEENKERRFLIDPMAYQDAEDLADENYELNPLSDYAKHKVNIENYIMSIASFSIQ